MTAEGRQPDEQPGPADRAEEGLERALDGDRGASGSGGGAPSAGAEEAPAAEVPEQDKPKSYGTILEEEIFQGLHELERPAGGLFLSGLSAGLDIGFSLFLMATVLTVLGGDLSDPLTKILVANMYPVGFVFVIVGRSELFTEHTTLAVFPVLGGKARVGRLARLWGLIYASNLVGAAVFAALAAWVGPALGAVEVTAFGAIAEEMVAHDWPVMLGSAILAGWMMGLLSWTLAAAQETISRILLVWLVTAAIGLAGLHHCVVGTVEVLAGVFSGQQSLGQYGYFLLWATLGNALGGVFFVALVKYSHAIKGPMIPPGVRHGA